MMERAKESDLKELFDLINLSYDVERGNDGLAFKNTDRFKTVDSFRKLVGNTWVVRDNSSEKRRIMACATLQVRDGVAFLGPMAVHPDHQRKGLGSQMLAFAETFAPIVKVTVVSCRTDLFPMYEKKGYKTVDVRPVEEYIPPERLTREGIKMVVMTKEVK